MIKKMIILPCIAAVTIAGVVGKKTLGSTNAHECNELLMANVEALTQNEEGTPVGDCYTMGSIGMSENLKRCDERTSNKMLYPCPQSSVPGPQGVRGTCTL